MTTKSQQLTMQVELAVIEHLGIKMYTQLPPVISETVANAWDAEAEHVEVSVSADSKQISVRDDGLGMTFDQVNNWYLRIGRNRREEEGTDVSSGKKHRQLMGRKGIGKLAGFGVAEEIEIRTIKNGTITHFSMSIDDIQEATKKKTEYHPKLLEDNGQSAEDGEVGTEVVLKRLKRKSAVDVQGLRKGLARRFSVIGTDFEVSVNEEPITVQERDLKGKCQFVWSVGDPLFGEGWIQKDNGWRVTGWIGTFPKPVPANIGAGVVVMVRGKLAQEPTLFEVAQMEGQHALAYVVGEIHADFLDVGESDFVSSYRGSVVWASEEGDALMGWAQEALRKVAKDWVKKRRGKRESVIRDDGAFKEWYSHLNGRDRKTVSRIIAVITSREDDDPRETRALFHYVIESFEYKAFAELVREMESLPEERAGDLLKLFHEWQLIEAREIFKILDGRLAAITRLAQLMKQNAREVPEIHGFLSENPWIIEPTWTVAYNEVHFSTLLKAQFPEDDTPVENRRIDFVCMGVGDTVHVVELKRPSVKIGGGEISQVQKYVTFVADRLGSCPARSYRDARGYLIGGELTQEGQTMLEKYSQGIYFLPYDDLLRNAERLHEDYIKVLSKFGVERPVLQAFAEDAALVEAKVPVVTGT